MALAPFPPFVSLRSLVLCSLRKPLTPSSEELGQLGLGLGAGFSAKQVDDLMDLLWADSMRFLGGESRFGSVNKFGPSEFRPVCGVGIACGRVVEEESAWNRDLRGSDWRRERVGGGSCSGDGGGGGVGVSGLGGLRILESHLWTAAAGDDSEGEESGASRVLKDSDLLRECPADFDMISPLKLSTALCLFQSTREREVVWMMGTLGANTEGYKLSFSCCG